MEMLITSDYFHKTTDQIWIEITELIGQKEKNQLPRNILPSLAKGKLCEKKKEKKRFIDQLVLFRLTFIYFIKYRSSCSEVFSRVAILRISSM